jgi:hypothetical protein
MPLVFILKLKTNETDVYRRLRRALKTILRRDQLRCISIEKIEETDTQRRIPVISNGVCAGHLVDGAHGIEAIDLNARSLGLFGDVIAATAAVEKSAARACSE